MRETVANFSNESLCLKLEREPFYPACHPMQYVSLNSVVNKPFYWYKSENHDFPVLLNIAKDDKVITEHRKRTTKDFKLIY